MRGHSYSLFLITSSPFTQQLCVQHGKKVNFRSSLGLFFLVLRSIFWCCRYFRSSNKDFIQTGTNIAEKESRVYNFCFLIYFRPPPNFVKRKIKWKIAKCFHFQEMQRTVYYFAVLFILTNFRRTFANHVFSS